MANSDLQFKMMGVWFTSSLFGYLLLILNRDKKKTELLPIPLHHRKTSSKYICSRCGQAFSSGQAMGGHKSACNIKKK